VHGLVVRLRNRPHPQTRRCTFLHAGAPRDGLGQAKPTSNSTNRQLLDLKSTRWPVDAKKGFGLPAGSRRYPTLPTSHVRSVIARAAVAPLPPRSNRHAACCGAWGGNVCSQFAKATTVYVLLRTCLASSVPDRLQRVRRDQTMVCGLHSIEHVLCLGSHGAELRASVVTFRSELARATLTQTMGAQRQHNMPTFSVRRYGRDAAQVHSCTISRHVTRASNQLHVIGTPQSTSRIPSSGRSRRRRIAQNMMRHDTASCRSTRDAREPQLRTASPCSTIIATPCSRSNNRRAPRTRRAASKPPRPPARRQTHAWPHWSNEHAHQAASAAAAMNVFAPLLPRHVPWRR
jgi:hypothetical protein